MAKKYGIGATNGKKATTYVATAPDGTILKKKSFFIHTETALIGAFQHEGKWRASGVTEEVRDWGSQIFLEAQKT
jgi:hypothetical protein